MRIETRGARSDEPIELETVTRTSTGGIVPLLALRNGAVSRTTLMSSANGLIPQCATITAAMYKTATRRDTTMIRVKAPSDPDASVSAEILATIAEHRSPA